MVLYEIYVWTKRDQTQIALSEFLQLNYQSSYSSCIRGSILQYEYSKMIVIITTCIKLLQSLLTVDYSSLRMLSVLKHLCA